MILSTATNASQPANLRRVPFLPTMNDADPTAFALPADVCLLLPRPPSAASSPPRPALRTWTAVDGRSESAAAAAWTAVPRKMPPVAGGCTCRPCLHTTPPEIPENDSFCPDVCVFYIQIDLGLVVLRLSMYANAAAASGHSIRVDEARLMATTQPPVAVLRAEQPCPYMDAVPTQQALPI